MKHIRNITETIKGRASELQQTQEAQSQPIIGKAEKDKVDWFYDALASTYGAGKWAQTFPDELSLSKSKNLYAEDICELTKEQVQRGLKEIKRKKQALDNNYLWPDIFSRGLNEFGYG